VPVRDTHTYRQTRLKIMALQVCNRAKSLTSHRNVNSDGEALSVDGKPFHALVAVTEKAQSHSVIPYDELTKLATLCWQNEDDDDRRHPWHGMDCQQDMTALYHEGNETREPHLEFAE